MPDPAAHPPTMFIIRKTTLPRFWWLKPWTTARTLAVTVDALRSYADRADAAVKTAEADLSLVKLSRLHWMHRAERAHAVAMHNERVILEMENRPRG
jgi:hypothetical protein